MPEWTDKERTVVRAIAEHLELEGNIPSQMSVKMDIDRDWIRFPQGLIQGVYSKLQALDFLSGPGKFTGRCYSTEAGRDFFSQFLDNLSRYGLLSKVK